MHERSLVGSLLRQVEQIRREQRAESISEVRVEVGPMSGVETELLHSAFEQLATAATVATAQLVIDLVPLMARCDRCDAEQVINHFDFHCQSCGETVTITQGADIQFVSVTLVHDEPAEKVLP